MNLTSVLIEPRPVVRPRERRRTVRFWLGEFAPAFFSGVVGSGALVGLLAWAKWAVS